jgi:hypothetical protein
MTDRAGMGIELGDKCKLLFVVFHPNWHTS